MYRVDVGGSMMFNPDGTFKDASKFFSSNLTSVRATVDCFTKDEAAQVSS